MNEKNYEPLLKNMSYSDLMDMEHPELLLESLEPFNRMMMMYRCASMEIETKLKVLNEEFSLHHNRNPIETIKTRIKDPLSILEKTKRKSIPFTIEGLEQNMFDIAGIRVICAFPEDIYTVRNLLIKQDDVRLYKEKDYIKHPKPNGYRSLHLIVEVPIFLAEEKKPMKVEVQLRTIAMDCWASLDHKLKYKQNVENADEIAAKLKKCADISSELDFRMQEIRREIDAGSI